MCQALGHFVYQISFAGFVILLRRLHCKGPRIPDLLHSFDDVYVAGAPAQIRGKHIDDLFIGHARVFLQCACDQHQETRSAKAALQCVVLNESLLQRIKLVTDCQVFNRANLVPLRLDSEHQACTYRLSVDKNGASAADAMLTPDMRAGKAAVFAQSVREGFAGLNMDAICLGVYVEGKVGFICHDRLSLFI
jgi:hypothetical protein